MQKHDRARALTWHAGMHVDVVIREPQYEVRSQLRLPTNNAAHQQHQITVNSAQRKANIRNMAQPQAFVADLWLLTAMRSCCAAPKCEYTAEAFSALDILDEHNASALCGRALLLRPADTQ